MDRPLVQKVIDSPLPVPITVSHIEHDAEGGLRFYLGPQWHGHYVVIQDEASLEIMRARMAHVKGSTITINYPPADKFYCDRNGHCPCEGPS
jgi:hypothetical protein